METEEIIYGRRSVLEYIRKQGDGAPGELYVYKNAHGKIIDEITGEARKKKITISYRDKDFFSSLCRSSEHQGIALRPARGGEKTGSGDMLETAAKNRGVLIFLDEITDPHNVGSIIRSAEAMGCGGIILTKSNSPGITPAVIKASAGATAHMGVLTVTNISGFLEGAKKKGFWIIGTGGDGGKSPGEISGYRPAIVIIGSEGKGMRKIVSSLCDITVGIPLTGRVESLNASVAAGIVIYEIMKTSGGESGSTGK